jgi:RimJ/RimL family protein N-acetyltransferase
MIDVIRLNDIIPKKPGVVYVPMVASHYYYMNVKGDGWLAAAKAVSLDQMLINQANLGTAVTCLLNGQPVGMFGIVELWTGVAEMWSIISEDARRYPKQLTLVGKAVCDIAAQSLRLHRLQITVRSDEEASLRWANYLGFEIEGLMRRYTPDGVDAYIMARK